MLKLTSALKLLSETLSEEVATDGTLAKVGVPVLAAAHSAEDPEALTI